MEFFALGRRVAPQVEGRHLEPDPCLIANGAAHREESRTGLLPLLVAPPAHEKKVDLIDDAEETFLVDDEVAGHGPSADRQLGASPLLILEQRQRMLPPPPPPLPPCRVPHMEVHWTEWLIGVIIDAFGTLRAVLRIPKVQ